MATTEWLLIFGAAGFLLNIAAIAFGLFKLGRAVEKFEQVGNRQASEITELKDAVKAMAKLTTHAAVQTQRQDALQEDLVELRREFNDLRRGEGFILPGLAGPRSSP